MRLTEEAQTPDLDKHSDANERLDVELLPLECGSFAVKLEDNDVRRATVQRDDDVLTPQPTRGRVARSGGSHAQRTQDLGQAWLLQPQAPSGSPTHHRFSMGLDIQVGRRGPVRGTQEEFRRHSQTSHPCEIDHSWIQGC